MKHSFSIQFASKAIDREAGVIRGVSVITEGEAQGHGCYIDATTLSQVKQCADAFGAAGVRVKVNHYSGVDAIVGTLRSFRIDGQQLRADLYLLKTHEIFERILEMAASIPESFGLSISFSGTPEKIDRVEYARCTELYSVDIVDRPAANPTGLFSVDSAPSDRMTEKELSAVVEKGNETLLQKIQGFVSGDTALRTQVTDLTTKLTTAETNLKTEQGKVTDLTTKLTTATTDLATRTTERDNAVKERDEFKTKFEKAVADLKAAGSKEASTILAALGVPPVEVKGTTTTTGDDKNKNDGEKKGRARWDASFRIIGVEQKTKTA